MSTAKSPSLSVVDQPDESLWDAKDVAKYLKASRNWVYQQAEAGTIPSFKIGGLVRFDPKVIRNLGQLAAEPRRGQVVAFTGRKD